MEVVVAYALADCLDMGHGHEDAVNPSGKPSPFVLELDEIFCRVAVVAQERWMPQAAYTRTKECPKVI